MLRECMDPLLGNGIFNTDGKMWLEQRKAASFMFSKRELVLMVDKFEKHFAFLETHLIDGKPVEFQDLSSKVVFSPLFFPCLTYSAVFSGSTRSIVFARLRLALKLALCAASLTLAQPSMLPRRSVATTSFSFSDGFSFSRRPLVGSCFIRIGSILARFCHRSGGSSHRWRLSTRSSVVSFTSDAATSS